jgi:hypothetical protein
MGKRNRPKTTATVKGQEDSKRGPQSVPLARGKGNSGWDTLHARASERRDILGMPLSQPRYTERPQTTSVLEMWGARPLLG